LATLTAYWTPLDKTEVANGKATHAGPLSFSPERRQGKQKEDITPKRTVRTINKDIYFDS